MDVMKWGQATFYAGKCQQGRLLATETKKPADLAISGLF